MNKWLKKNRVRIRNIILGLVIIALLAIVFFVVYVYLNTLEENLFPSNRADFGQLGDYFGGTLNPIFGFASFIALLVTIVYQAKELKLSRKELELTREELSKSASALSLQNKAIELQSFEQTFFSWLSTYQSLLNSITEEKKINDIPHKITGRAALNVFWGNYFNYSFMEKFSNKKKADYSHSEILEDWNKLYIEAEYQLDSLFRTLYRLILWVDTQNIEKLTIEQKWLYISIVRSQLSSIELKYLYLNGLTDRGSKFKTLAERYAIFDNLTFNDTTLTTLQKKLPNSLAYSPEAYQSELAKLKLGI